MKKIIIETAIRMRLSEGQIALQKEWSESDQENVLLDC